jgi:hypothetical protein
MAYLAITSLSGRKHMVEKDSHLIATLPAIFGMPVEIIYQITSELCDNGFGNFRKASKWLRDASLHAWQQRAKEDKDNIPPLEWAATRGKSTLIEFLLRSFPEINFSTPGGRHAGGCLLHIACLHWNYKAAKALITHGVDVNYIPPGGVSVLLAACESG